MIPIQSHVNRFARFERRRLQRLLKNSRSGSSRRLGGLAQVIIVNQTVFPNGKFRIGKHTKGRLVAFKKINQMSFAEIFAGQLTGTANGQSRIVNKGGPPPKPSASLSPTYLTESRGKGRWKCANELVETVVLKDFPNVFAFAYKYIHRM